MILRSCELWRHVIGRVGQACMLHNMLRSLKMMLRGLEMMLRGLEMILRDMLWGLGMKSLGGILIIPLCVTLGRSLSINLLIVYRLTIPVALWRWALGVRSVQRWSVMHLHNAVRARAIVLVCRVLLHALRRWSVHHRRPSNSIGGGRCRTSESVGTSGNDGGSGSDRGSGSDGDSGSDGSSGSLMHLHSAVRAPAIVLACRVLLHALRKCSAHSRRPSNNISEGRCGIRGRSGSGGSGSDGGCGSEGSRGFILPPVGGGNASLGSRRHISRCEGWAGDAWRGRGAFANVWPCVEAQHLLDGGIRR